MSRPRRPWYMCCRKLSGRRWMLKSWRRFVVRGWPRGVAFRKYHGVQTGFKGCKSAKKPSKSQNPTEFQCFSLFSSFSRGAEGARGQPFTPLSRISLRRPIYPAGSVIEFWVNCVGISKNLKIALPARLRLVSWAIFKFFDIPTQFTQNS